MIPHLLWCTATAILAIVVVFLLRRRSAALRFNILLVAMLRFAVPTPWLSQAGAALADRLPAPIRVNVSEFLRGPTMELPASMSRTLPTEVVPAITLAEVAMILWALGTLVALVIFLRRMRGSVPEVRASTALEREALWRAADRMQLRQRAELRIVAEDRVPGALGISRPVVVLPDGLSEQLSDAELQSVLAHELAHVQRRDSLTDAVARALVATFWFHPLVAWMAERMRTERETACDELVLAHGTDREHYLAGIAKVCQRAMEQHHSYAGITGANLKDRLEHIMSVRKTHVSMSAQMIPATMAMLAILIPAAGGFLRAQAPVAPVAANPKIEPIVISQAQPGGAPNRSADAPGSTQRAASPNRNGATADLQGLAGRIEEAMAAKNPDLAIQQLREALDKEPGRQDLMVALGNIYTRAERYDDAIVTYKEALGVARNPAPILFRMGETYRRKGDLKKAIEYFAGAADNDPTDVGAMLQMALILDGTGEKARAEFVYESILKINNNHAVALNNLAYRLAEDGDAPTRAVEMAQRAAKALPDSADAADTLGWAYYKNNQPELAVMSFRDAVSQSFDRASLQGHLAMALEKVSDPSPVMKELRILLKDYPSETRDQRISQLLRELK